MLRFKFENIPELFFALGGVATIAEAQAVEVSQATDGKITVDQAIQALTKYKEFSSGTIPLPRPLRDLRLEFNSNGRIYSGQAIIQPRGYAIAESEECLDKALKRLESDQKILSLGSSGLVVTDGTPLFSIGRYQSLITVSFGDGGTIRRRITGKGGSAVTQFGEDMTRFSNVLEDVVNACYDKPTPDINYCINLREGYRGQ